MSFEEDLDYSYKQSKRPFWAEAYKRYFGDRDLKTDLITPVEDRPDSGADKLVTLSNGHSYLIDEKVHRRKGFQDDMRSASAMFLEAGVGFEYIENR